MPQVTQMRVAPWKSTTAYVCYPAGQSADLIRSEDWCRPNDTATRQTTCLTDAGSEPKNLYPRSTLRVAQVVVNIVIRLREQSKKK